MRMHGLTISDPYSKRTNPERQTLSNEDIDVRQNENEDLYAFRTTANLQLRVYGQQRIQRRRTLTSVTRFPSRKLTPVNTPGYVVDLIYIERGKIGDGTFGEVYEGLNASSEAIRWL